MLHGFVSGSCKYISLLNVLDDRWEGVWNDGDSDEKSYEQNDASGKDLLHILIKGSKSDTERNLDGINIL